MQYNAAKPHLAEEYSHSKQAHKKLKLFLTFHDLIQNTYIRAHLLRRLMSLGVLQVIGESLHIRANQKEYRQNKFIWAIRVS